MRALVAVLAAAALWACTSNPTPHPGQPDGYGPDTVTAPDGTSQGGGSKGPDLDRDGVPDCEEYGGFWDQTDSVCVGGTPTNVSDADAGDGDASDADASDADASDGDADEGADGAGADASVGE